jgi:hypothetical protein
MGQPLALSPRLPRREIKRKEHEQNLSVRGGGGSTIVTGSGGGGLGGCLVIVLLHLVIVGVGIPLQAGRVRGAGKEG